VCASVNVAIVYKRACFEYFFFFFFFFSPYIHALFCSTFQFNAFFF